MLDHRRKSVEWRQLCAIARDRLEQDDPAIDDAEWKARVLDRLARLGFTEPDRQTLDRAMSAVERVFEKQHGPRPSPVVSQAPPKPIGGPLNDREARAFKANLEARGLLVTPRSMGGPSSSQPNRTFEQIRDWQAEQWQKARAEGPQWVKTPKGWVRRPDKPSSDAPSNDSVEAKRDEEILVNGAASHSN
jgi:hypothetical protein